MNLCLFVFTPLHFRFLLCGTRKLGGASRKGLAERTLGSFLPRARTWVATPLHTGGIASMSNTGRGRGGGSTGSRIAPTIPAADGLWERCRGPRSAGTQPGEALTAPGGLPGPGPVLTLWQSLWKGCLAGGLLQRAVNLVNGGPGDPVLPHLGLLRGSFSLLGAGAVGWVVSRAGCADSSGCPHLPPLFAFTARLLGMCHAK